MTSWTEWYHMYVYVYVQVQYKCIWYVFVWCNDETDKLKNLIILFGLDHLVPRPAARFFSFGVYQAAKSNQLQALRRAHKADQLKEYQQYNTFWGKATDSLTQYNTLPFTKPMWYIWGSQTRLY